MYEIFSLGTSYETVFCIGCDIVTRKLVTPSFEETKVKIRGVLIHIYVLLVYVPL